MNIKTEIDLAAQAAERLRRRSARAVAAGERALSRAGRRPGANRRSEHDDR